MPLKEARTSIKQLVLDLRKKHPDYGVEYETYVHAIDFISTLQAQAHRVLEKNGAS